MWNIDHYPVGNRGRDVATIYIYDIPWTRVVVLDGNSYFRLAEACRDRIRSVARLNFVFGLCPEISCDIGTIVSAAAVIGVCSDSARMNAITVRGRRA